MGYYLHFVGGLRAALGTECEWWIGGEYTQPWEAKLLELGTRAGSAGSAGSAVPSCGNGAGISGSRAGQSGSQRLDFLMFV